MENNSISTLKNYISHVLMLEKTKYELLHSIESQKKSIVHPNIIGLRAVGKRESYTNEILLALPLIVILLLFKSCSNDIHSTNLHIRENGYMGMVLWGFIGLFFITVFIVSIIDTINRNKTIDSLSAQNDKINEKNKIASSNAMVANRLINNAISEYNNVLSSVTNTLNKYYSKNIIYIKYRNLTALTYIFEYLDSCRAETLVEAYNLFEQELRLDIIISKLDIIIRKLDTIIDNQFDILQSVKENTKMIQETSNRLLKKANEISQSQNLINSNLNSIKENTEVIKKATLIMETNQYYERNWNNMRGRYDQFLINKMN